MKVNTETLIKYVQGELPVEQKKTIDALIAEDKDHVLFYIVQGLKIEERDSDSINTPLWEKVKEYQNEGRRRISFYKRKKVSSVIKGGIMVTSMVIFLLWKYTSINPIILENRVQKTEYYGSGYDRYTKDIGCNLI